MYLNFWPCIHAGMMDFMRLRLAVDILSGSSSIFTGSRHHVAFLSHFFSHACLGMSAFSFLPYSGIRFMLYFHRMLIVNRFSWMQWTLSLPFTAGPARVFHQMVSFLDPHVFVILIRSCDFARHPASKSH